MRKQVGYPLRSRQSEGVQSVAIFPKPNSERQLTTIGREILPRGIGRELYLLPTAGVDVYRAIGPRQVSDVLSLCVFFGRARNDIILDAYIVGARGKPRGLGMC